MEHVGLIEQLITSLGFPIVVAVALFWYINKKDEQHKEEINSMRDALNKNTSVLEELKTLINVFVTEIKKNDS